MHTRNEVTLLEAILEPRTAEQARWVLTLDLSPSDQAHREELLARAHEGKITPEEQADLDAYQNVRVMLNRLQANAQNALVLGMLPRETEGTPIDPATSRLVIPPGIRRSQDALRRELNELLANKKLCGQWVCYAGDERIGIARTQQKLIEECMRRGLRDDQYYIGMIDTNEFIEVEEVEHGLCEFDEEEGDEFQSIEGNPPHGNYPGSSPDRHTG